MSPTEVLMAAISQTETKKPRNKQKSIGPSSVGDCRRRVWLQMQGVEGTNPTKSMASFMGSAIHDSISQGMRRLDPFRYLVEQRLERDGIVGTVDCYDTETGTVIDWKTTKKSSLGWLATKNELGKSADKWPSLQQRWQVALYGWMLRGAGHDVKHVSLVGIARDGDEDHVREHVEPYDQDLVDEALAWLRDVESMTEPPAPEKSGAFCRSYCKFYGSACHGMEGDTLG